MASPEALEELKSLYTEKEEEIKGRIQEFEYARENADDTRILEELCFCILTSAVGPKVGMKSLHALQDILLEGNEQEIYGRLKGVHKYPEKAAYIVHTLDYLKNEYGLKMRELVDSFDAPQERRDFFALNKNIKGLGLTQASHFLRNIGFKGYAILDRNVVNSLFKLGVIESPKPPTSKKRYLETEEKMRNFAEELGIEIEELDLLLWSMKRGYIPK
jgi:N-glycosylase/DNA lyase